MPVGMGQSPPRREGCRGKAPPRMEAKSRRKEETKCQGWRHPCDGRTEFSLHMCLADVMTHKGICPAGTWDTGH